MNKIQLSDPEVFDHPPSDESVVCLGDEGSQMGDDDVFMGAEQQHDDVKLDGSMVGQSNGKSSNTPTVLTDNGFIFEDISDEEGEAPLVEDDEENAPVVVEKKDKRKKNKKKKDKEKRNKHRQQSEEDVDDEEGEERRDVE